MNDLQDKLERSRIQDCSPPGPNPISEVRSRGSSEAKGSTAAPDRSHEPGFSLFSAIFYALQTMAYHHDSVPATGIELIPLPEHPGGRAPPRPSPTKYNIVHSGLWECFSRDAALILYPSNLSSIIKDAWNDILTPCGRYFFSLDGDPDGPTSSEAPIL
jgi:hypothetical protein